MNTSANVRYVTYDSDGLCGCTHVLPDTVSAPGTCEHGHPFRLRLSAKPDAVSSDKPLTDEQRLKQYDGLALWLLHDADFVDQFPDSARTMERLLNSCESKADHP